MRSLILVLVLFVAIVLVIFGVQNPQSVQIAFLSFYSGPVSLSVVIVSSALIGALVPVLISVGDQIRRGWARRKNALEIKATAARLADLEKQVMFLNHENAELRSAAKQSPAQVAASHIDSAQHQGEMALMQA